MFNSGYDYIIIRDMAMSNYLMSNDLKIIFLFQLNKITDEYEIIHFEHFMLDFNKEIIKEDLDIDININTYYKLILRRKNV